MLELADRLGLDLADSLAGNGEDLADLFERVGVAVGQAVAEADDLPLAVVQCGQDFGNSVFQRDLVHVLERVVVAVVFQELAEVAVVVVADRLVERKRLAAHLQHAVGLIDREAGQRGGFLDRRFATFLLNQGAGDRADPAHGFNHVDGDADRAALIGDRPGDRLANPPGGVGRELVAAGVLELVDGPHQAGVAFLDQVEEAQTAVAVSLGDGNDQPQVARREPSLGGLVMLLICGRLPDSAAERRRAFQRDFHELAEVAPRLVDAAGRVAEQPQLLHFRHEQVHSP